MMRVCGKAWQSFFDTHALIYNRRAIVMIALSKERDAGFAIGLREGRRPWPNPHPTYD
jgi:hypothetical protein